MATLWAYRSARECRLLPGRGNKNTNQIIRQTGVHLELLFAWTTKRFDSYFTYPTGPALQVDREQLVLPFGSRFRCSHSACRSRSVSGSAQFWSNFEFERVLSRFAFRAPKFPIDDFVSPFPSRLWAYSQFWKFGLKFVFLVAFSHLVIHPMIHQAAARANRQSIWTPGLERLPDSVAARQSNESCVELFDWILHVVVVRWERQYDLGRWVRIH